MEDPKTVECESLDWDLAGVMDTCTCRMLSHYLFVVVFGLTSERDWICLHSMIATKRIMFMLALSGSLDKKVEAFSAVSIGLSSSTSTSTTRGRPASSTLLKAKKVGKSKRKSAVAAGGFGRKEAESPAVDTDYAIFPALEPRVQETLVPAALSGGITNEIYHRLDQIYGFSEFNYSDAPESSNVEESQIMSFEDMLSASSSSSSSSGLDSLLKPSSASSSSMGSSDLDSLLAAATGGEASTVLSSLSSKPQERPDSEESADISRDLSRLPPFDDIRVLHVDPLVLSIDNFFTDEECDRYIEASLNHKNSKGNVMMSRSPTVGKDAAAKAQRTSTTFYHMYKGVPELMSRASRLLGLSSITHWEEPQTVRYRRNEKFTWHLDALGPMEQQQSSAGQRTATLLVYLTSLQDNEGGATLFRDLGGANEQYLGVQPRKGSALLFFPAAGGIPDCPFDIRTLHSGQVVSEDSENDKWIAQLWLRQKPYFPPTAPPGNRHAQAAEAIAEYCKQNAKN